jgi:hypothetical protein
MDTSLGMSVHGYNNKKLTKQKMIQKRKKACAEFEEQIRKTCSLESWTEVVATSCL